MLPIKQFTANFAALDDNGKPCRVECQVVGLTADLNFVVIATDDDGDRMGALEVGEVFMRDRAAR